MVINSVSIAYGRVTSGYATYRPGDTVEGVMTLVIGGYEPHKLSSLLVKVRGLAHTKWKTSSGSGKNRRTHVHTESLWLIREDIFFIRGPAVEALHPGTYQYSFSHRLRTGLPPTFSCEYGEISYLCKARAISNDLFAFNGKSEYAFTVLPVLDLSTQPAHLAEPRSVTATAEQSLFGHPIGQFTLKMSHQMAVGGQRISFTIDGPERLFSKQLKGAGFVKLKRLTLCKANSHERAEKRELVVLEPGQSRDGWHSFELTVPTHEGMSISESMCRIITVSHYIKIHSRHITLSLPLVVGTVAPQQSRVPSATSSPYHASPYHASPYNASPYNASPYNASPYNASPYRIRSRTASPCPSAPQLAGGAEPWRRSSPQDMHSPSAPVLPSASAAAAAAAAAAAVPDYDPPPSYDQVMSGGLFAGGEKEKRARSKEREATGFQHMADL